MGSSEQNETYLDAGEPSRSFNGMDWKYQIQFAKDHLGFESENSIREAADISSRTVNVAFPSFSVRAGIKAMIHSVRENTVFYPKLLDEGNHIGLGVAHAHFELHPPKSLTNKEDQTAFKTQAKSTITNLLRWHELKAIQTVMEKSGRNSIEGIDQQMSKADLATLLDTNEKAINQGVHTLELLAKGIRPTQVGELDRERIATAQKKGREIKFTFKRGLVNTVLTASVDSSVEEAVQKIRRFRSIRRNVSITSVGLAFTISCCAPTTFPVVFTETPTTTPATSPTPEATSTPEIPFGLPISQADINKFLDGNTDPNIDPQKIQGFDMGAEKLLFGQGKDGLNYGRIFVNGVWKAIYGTVAPDNSVIWALPKGGATPVAPGTAISDFDVVLTMDLRTDAQGNIIAQYTPPEESKDQNGGKVFKISVDSPIASGIKMAAPIDFEIQKALLPENLGGDTRYSDEIQKHQWEYGVDEKTGNKVIKVNWTDTVDKKGKPNYEVAYEKVGDNWEIRKFVLKRWEVDISKMTCVDIQDRSKAGSCVQETLENPVLFYVKFKAGDLVMEQRKDPFTGEVLPGSVIYTYAHTRRVPGGPEEVVKIAVQIDIGDGIDILHSPTKTKPVVSIFDVSRKLSSDDAITYIFTKSKYNEYDHDYYKWLNVLISFQKQLYDGVFDPSTIFYPVGFTIGPVY